MTATSAAAKKTDLASIFADAYRRLRPRAPIPEIQAEFFPFAGLNHTIRRRSGRLSARVSDILHDAPVSVIRMVASLLLARLYREPVDSAIHEEYRRYVLSEEIQQRIYNVRRERSRRTNNAPSGRFVNLETVFDRLNARHFEGELTRPALVWSRGPSRRRLAFYDAARESITVSRFFDSPDVPRYVTDYIVFHEMLHMKYAARPGGFRLVTHSQQFRNAERAFPAYAAANAWLDSALDGTGTNASLEKLA